MPGPAARIGDMTAHGGVILPPGVPTVLIGGVPAATVSGMHVCPMVTGVVPHVGGPILPPGVPTVLIGGLPAATVGDMATCVGPPDVILPPGCPTVLIGTGGGGSGGAGGGAVAAATMGAHSALVGEPGPEKEGPHWIEYQFKDAAGNPITGVPYEYTSVDDRKTEGVLTKDGVIKKGGLPDEGDCIVKLLTVTNAKWSTDSAKAGDEVELTADVEGYEDGTPAEFEVWEKDIDGADHSVTKIEATVDGGQVKAKWIYAPHEDSDEAVSETKSRGYSAPVYYFVVKVKHRIARSPLLEYKDWIEIKLKDGEGNPIANEKYRVVFASGEAREGTLDQNGYAKLEEVPFAAWDIMLPDIDRAIETKD